MNALVPLLAIVPRWSTMASRSMPIPLSETISVPASVSATSLIFQSVFPSATAGSVNAANRALSIASAALLTSSRTKISFFV